MIDPNQVLKMIWLLFGAIAVTFCSMFGRVAHGYIPKGRVILEKVGRQHGKGAYVIQQEVSFRDPSGNLTVIEDWVVENGESIALDVRGGGQRASYVYKGKQKIFVDEMGTEKSAVLGADFFEPAFFYRGWENLAEFLVKEKILTTKNIPRENFKKDIKEYGYVPDSFVRLSRVSGVVAYAFGQPTPVDSSRALPGLWVEQDRFLIRKIRLNSQAEVSADDYGEFSNGLWFPKSRTVAWGNQAVHLRVLKISSTSLPPSIKARLSPTGLRKRPDSKEQFTNPTVSEFYKRFR